MARKIFEASVAPQQEVGVGAAENQQIEAGAALEISENSSAKADRLFNLMSKEMRDKRKMAKSEGKSEAEIKAIKFDKESIVYKEWLDACSDNHYAGLVKAESYANRAVEESAAAGENVDNNGLRNKWITALRKQLEAKHAREDRKKLNSRLSGIVAERSDLTAKVGQLGEKPVFNAEMVSLDSEAAVVVAQRDAVEGIAVGLESTTETPPLIPVDYLEEVLSDDDLEEIDTLDEFFDSDNSQTPEGLEVSVGGKGVEKITTQFAKELAKDQKAGIVFRETIFTSTLNRLVEDDEVFAALLLKNSNFLKVVGKMFDVKISVFGNKALEEAAKFVSMLEQSRSIYDDVRKKRELDATSTDAPVAESNIGVNGMDNTGIKDYFSAFERVDIKTPGELRNRVAGFREDMKIQRANLDIQQDALNQCKWYQLNKKSELKSQIKDTVSEISALFEALVYLGEEITAEQVSAQSLSNSELADLNSVLNNQVKQLATDIKSGKEVITSKGFFDKYTEVGIIMLGVATLASLALGGHDSSSTRPQADLGKASMVKVAEKEAPRLSSNFIVTPDRLGDNLNSDKVVAPSLDENNSSVVSEDEGVADEGSGNVVTPTTEDTTPDEPAVSQPRVHKKKPRVKKPVSSEQAPASIDVVQDFSDYSERMAGYDRRISDLIKEIESFKNDSVPVLDIANLNASAAQDASRDLKELGKKEKELENLRQEQTDYSVSFHEHQISKEGKIPEAAPLGRMEMPTNFGYGGLDFSREYVGNLGTAHDIVREIQELAPVANDSQRRAFMKKAKSAIVLCDMFLAKPGNSQGEITEANLVRQEASRQHKALKENLPQDPNIEGLAGSVKSNVDRLVDAFSQMTGSGREGARIVGANGILEKLQMIVINALTTGEINSADKTSLRLLKKSLSELSRSKELTKGEIAVVVNLQSIVDTLLRGVPKSDELSWSVPSSGTLDHGKMLGLQSDIEDEANRR